MSDEENQIEEEFDDDLEEELEEEFEEESEEEIVEDEEYVGIPLWEYEELKDHAKKLHFLEEAGVENWSGYDYAMENMANFEEDVDE